MPPRTIAVSDVIISGIVFLSGQINPAPMRLVKNPGDPEGSICDVDLVIKVPWALPTPGGGILII